MSVRSGPGARAGRVDGRFFVTTGKGEKVEVEVDAAEELMNALAAEAEVYCGGVVADAEAY